MDHTMKPLEYNAVDFENYVAAVDIKGDTSASHSANVSVHHAPSDLLLQQKAKDGDHDRNEKQNALNLSQSSGQQNLEGRHQILELGAMQNSSRDSQLSKMHRQSAAFSKQGSRTKQISFGNLLPFILPKLDEDKAIQLHSLYAKLRKSGIQKDGFVRKMRQLVGDSLLKVAVIQMQAELVASESRPVPEKPMQKYHLEAPVTSASCQFAQIHERRQDLEMQEPEALEDLSIESRFLCNMYLDSTSDSEMEDPSIESQLVWNIYTHSDSEKGSPTEPIAFGSLLPFILHELDEDKAMQVQTSYAKLWKNEDGFIRLMRKVVKKDVLEAAVVKMQAEKAS